MSAPSSTTDIVFDIAYGPYPEQKLDLYRVKDSAPRRPAVLLIHGGGWISGDKRDYRFIGRGAAAKGIVAIAMNYRLADGSAEHEWPAQLEDARTALRWTRDNAHEFGIDPDRICVSGNSAGGHLAVFLAVLRPPRSADVACVVDEFGPVELTTFFPRPPAVLFGNADPDALRRLMERASPIQFVTGNTAPILIVQGLNDSVVKPQQSEMLHAALVNAGVRTRYVAFPGGHGFTGITAAQYNALQDLELTFILESGSR